MRRRSGPSRIGGVVRIGGRRTIARNTAQREGMRPTHKAPAAISSPHCAALRGGAAASAVRLAAIRRTLRDNRRA